MSAAEDDRLPDLISAGQVRGALHVHSDYSDGSSTLEEMAEAARSRGLDYVGFCDHSKSAGYVFGLKEEDIRQQHEEIDLLNCGYDDFRIFKGIESDILKDGLLDYDDDVLDCFDFVVIAVHAPLNMTESEMTKRVVKAIEHPASTILAHPTGRLLLEREGFPISIDDILAAAADHGVSVELKGLTRKSQAPIRIASISTGGTCAKLANSTSRSPSILMPTAPATSITSTVASALRAKAG